MRFRRFLASERDGSFPVPRHSEDEEGKIGKLSCILCKHKARDWEMEQKAQEDTMFDVLDQTLNTTDSGTPAMNAPSYSSEYYWTDDNSSGSFGVYNADDEDSLDQVLGIRAFQTPTLSASSDYAVLQLGDNIVPGVTEESKVGTTRAKSAEIQGITHLKSNNYEGDVDVVVVVDDDDDEEEEEENDNDSTGGLVYLAPHFQVQQQQKQLQQSPESAFLSSSSMDVSSQNDSTAAESSTVYGVQFLPEPPELLRDTDLGFLHEDDNPTDEDTTKGLDVSMAKSDVCLGAAVPSLIARQRSGSPFVATHPSQREASSHEQSSPTASIEVPSQRNSSPFQLPSQFDALSRNDSHESQQMPVSGNPDINADRNGHLETSSVEKSPVIRDYCSPSPFVASPKPMASDWDSRLRMGRHPSLRPEDSFERPSLRSRSPASRLPKPKASDWAAHPVIVERERQSASASDPRSRLVSFALKPQVLPRRTELLSVDPITKPDEGRTKHIRLEAVDDGPASRTELQNQTAAQQKTNTIMANMNSNGDRNEENSCNGTERADSLSVVTLKLLIESDHRMADQQEAESRTKSTASSSISELINKYEASSKAMQQSSQKKTVSYSPTSPHSLYRRRYVDQVLSKRSGPATKTISAPSGPQSFFWRSHPAQAGGYKGSTASVEPKCEGTDSCTSSTDADEELLVSDTLHVPKNGTLISTWQRNSYVPSWAFAERGEC